MNYDLVFVILFYLILYSLFVIFRSKFEVQNKFFIMYKTKWGLFLMDKIAKKWPKLLGFLGFFSVVSGFAGMIFILWILIKGTYALLFVENAVPVLSPVLPGIETIPGLPVLSFWHWIIAILLIATIHEFSHGVYARKWGIKIKSSGFAFLGPLLAAFVEPDEKQLVKKKAYPQLQVLSAGPFSNILTGMMFLVLYLLLIGPITSALVQERGVTIVSIDHNFPINNSLLKEGMNIEKIDETAVKNRVEFVNLLNKYKPGDQILIFSNFTNYKVILGADSANKSKVKLGVFVAPASVGLKESIKQKSFNFYPVYYWLKELLFWLFNISFGVGLFNLLPLGPVDGGRMFYVGMLAVFKKEKIAKQLYLFATTFCLLLIFINLVPFIIKLFQWLIGLIF